jgi:hypothetical protein
MFVSQDSLRSHQRSHMVRSNFCSFHIDLQTNKFAGKNSLSHLQAHEEAGPNEVPPAEAQKECCQKARLPYLPKDLHG